MLCFNNLLYKLSFSQIQETRMEKLRTRGNDRVVTYNETQQMFPQIFVHKIVFSCCFCMMKVYTEHVLIINFLV